MKTKRLIALFICLVFLTTVFVLGGTVFVVKNINVTFENDQKEISSNQVINASQIKIGKSVFTISESKVVKNIESQIHNLRVLNIERVFPNKIIIHTALREPVIALRVKDRHDVLVLDNNMTVIKLLNENDNSALNNLCVVEGYVLSGKEVVSLGSQLTNSFGKNVVIIQHIMNGLQKAGLRNNELASFLKNIQFTSIENDNSRLLIKTRSGVTIVMDSSEMTSSNFIIVERTKQSFEAYQKLKSDYKKSYGYLRYDNLQNEFKWLEN